MTEPANIDALIAEARRFITPHFDYAENDLIRRLADTLESVYADSLTAQAEHARWQERAEKAEAPSDDQVAMDNADWQGRLLPDPKGGCCCTWHSQDAGGGHTECLMEYEPACPEHSEHVYNPRTGIWERAEEPESTDTFEHGYQAAIADMRWLADGRDRYTDERVQFQVRSVQQVARALDGDERAAEGWLPSWMWGEWAAKRRYPWMPVEQEGEAG